VTGRVVVVGGGVIGLSCAYHLRRQGAEVTVLEGERVGAGASWGNAGWIIPVHSAPLPGPDVRREPFRWRPIPGAPLRIQTSRKSLSWALRFARASSDARWQAGLAALARFNAGAMEAFDDLAADGVEFEMHRSGVLFAFVDPAGAAHELELLAPMRAFGFTLPERPLGAKALRSLEPSLSDEVRSGFLIESERHVVPHTLLRGLVRRLREAGVDVLEGHRVTGFDVLDRRVRSVEVEIGPIEAEAVVLAAGAWTPSLTRLLGWRLPVRAAKGHSFSMKPSVMPSRPLYLVTARLACTPLGDRLRVAGTVEVGPIDRTIDQRRLASMLRATDRYLAGGAPTEIFEAWAGPRPLSPDGLPVIGRVPKHGNVYVATGHAMLGMTMAPITGRAVARMVLEGETPAEALPFTPDRF
jgi:D-amino-acid dehydrogenase